MITGITQSAFRYAIKRAATKAAYCAISIKSGTISEGNFPNGIAHFVEHSIFKGTKNKSAKVIINYLDKLGGELNAYTSKEEIVLHATSLKEDLPKAIGLLLELARFATFPSKEIEIEKGVVIDEIKSYKDNPAEDIYDEFEERFFEGHSLSKKVLGSIDSVSKISSENLINYVKENFKEENMVFSIVCNKDEEELERLLLRELQKVGINNIVSKNRQAETKQPKTPEKLKTKVFNERICRNNHEANIIIGGPAAGLYDEADRISTNLLCNILGGPASNSILNKELREKHGWVYNVDASYNQYSDIGLVCISFGCDKSNINNCINSCKKIINRIIQKGLSERQLKAAKKQFYGQLSISDDNYESQCLSMGKSLLSFNTILSDKQILERLNRVSIQDIQRVAKNIFSEPSILIID